MDRRAPRKWRHNIGALIVCAFALARPQYAVAQELWRGLDLGATPKSVLKAFPDASRPLSITTLADGETDDLVTHALFFGGRLMEVRFFFRDGSLSTVQLMPASIQAARTAQNLRLAHTLADDLTARYGSPFTCGDRSYAAVALFECKWLAKPTVIRLWYMDIAGQAPALRIAFRKVDDAAYDF